MNNTATRLTRPDTAVDAPVASPVEPTAPASAAPQRTSRGRVVAIDIARGLALLAMFTQHVVFDNDGDSTGVIGWLFRESAGRASVLFFLLSGMSLMMIHRRGSSSTQPRVLLAKATVLIGFGLLITDAYWDGSILQHYGVAFLLAPLLLRLSYRWLIGLTAALAVAGPIVLMFVRSFNINPSQLDGAFSKWVATEFVNLWATGNYPMLVWIALFMFGMVLGGTNLHAKRVAATMVAAGLAVTLAVGGGARQLTSSYGAGPSLDGLSSIGSSGSSIDGSSLSGSAVGSSMNESSAGSADTAPNEAADTEGSAGNDARPNGDTDKQAVSGSEADIAAGDDKFGAEKGFGEDGSYDDWKSYGSNNKSWSSGDVSGEPHMVVPVDWRSQYDVSGHSNRVGWVLQTGGIATAIIGLCLLLPGRVQRLLRPLSIMGSMSLTAYLFHIVLVQDVWAYTVTGRQLSIGAQEAATFALMGVMIAVCMVWHRVAGQAGPAERVMKVLTSGARTARPAPVNTTPTRNVVD